MRNIFIGGAWPYANNSLHVGHLAALLPGDILARYHRQVGDNVIYVSGTDSHGTPITIRAKKEGVSPKEIATKYHEEFTKNFNDLDFSYDLYTSTMTEYHEKHVQEYLNKIFKNGYIYEQEELQDYCPNCNTYLSDREIVGTCPHCGGVAKGDQCDSCLATLNAKEVKDKKCSACGTATVEKPNKHLYFKLSAFQDKINALKDANKDVWRFNAVKETEKFLDMGLIDRAVTRQLEWGVDVPFAGFEDKKVYVWIEAVMGYLTAGRKVAEEKGIDFDEFMKKGNVKSYYAHGKDNIPFHTVIFPSLLMAIDDNLNLPDSIISCEYVNMNNEKMSKSKGNLIRINELVESFPKDSVRYYMISNGPENKDCNFTIDNFMQVHNKFLVGVFGNFINRNLSYLNKKFEGNIPNGEIDQNIIALTKEAFETVGKLMEDGKIKLALEKAMDYASAGNKYYDDNKPWVQVTEDPTGFANTTYTCVYMMANMSNLFAPFMPETCQRVKNKLGLDKRVVWEPITIGKDLKVLDNELLFERLKAE
ncbi:MAG: methionine--tRNA ligase [Clostridiales bacterium]|nr:methionine--tRNA ligase [Clostridiales bacterium]